jgi:hypothetical protein
VEDIWVFRLQEGGKTIPVRTRQERFGGIGDGRGGGKYQNRVGQPMFGSGTDSGAKIGATRGLNPGPLANLYLRVNPKRESYH